MVPTQPIPRPMELHEIYANFIRQAAENFSIQKVKTKPMQDQEEKEKMQQVCRQALQLQVYIYCHISQINIF